MHRHIGINGQHTTLATPFNSLGGGNHAGTIYKLFNRDSSHLTPEIEARLRECPSVPTTSIYIVSHPEVLRIIANRLAQPEGQWRALRRSERLGRSRQRG